jgi:hypothetical protein
MVSIESDDDAYATAYAILKSRGYQLRHDINSDNGFEYDSVETTSAKFWGLSPVDVLGLMTIIETKGDDWRPTKKEIKSYDDFCKMYQQEDDPSILKDVASEVLKPKTMGRLFAIFISHGLRTFSMIGFPAVYLKYYMVLQSPLSLLILPLSMYGIWMSFNALDRAIDHFSNKWSKSRVDNSK